MVWYRGVLLISVRSSRTDSDVGKAFGWKPVHTEQDFKDHFLEEAKIIVQDK